MVFLNRFLKKSDSGNVHELKKKSNEAEENQFKCIKCKRIMSNRHLHSNQMCRECYFKTNVLSPKRKNANKNVYAQEWKDNNSDFFVLFQIKKEDLSAYTMFIALDRKTGQALKVKTFFMHNKKFYETESISYDSLREYAKAKGVLEKFQNISELNWRDFITDNQNITFEHRVIWLNQKRFDNCLIINGSGTINPFLKTESSSVENVFLGLEIMSVADSVFCNFHNLKRIFIPNNITHIGKNNFSEKSNVVIYGAPGSYAQNFAHNNNIKYLLNPITLYREGDHYEGVDISLHFEINGDLIIYETAWWPVHRGASNAGQKEHTLPNDYFAKNTLQDFIDFLSKKFNKDFSDLRTNKILEFLFVQSGQ